MSYYADWDDDEEIILYIARTPNLTEYLHDDVELLWRDSAPSAVQPVYQTTEKIFFSEADALNHIYSALADLNDIPHFDNAINLVKETPVIYSIDGTELLTFTWRKDRVLVYDSIKERIETIWITPDLKSNKTIQRYLEIR